MRAFLQQTSMNGSHTTVLDGKEKSPCICTALTIVNARGLTKEDPGEEGIRREAQAVSWSSGKGMVD